MKEYKRVKAEFIITIDGKPDIMGGYPVKERKELVRCKDCRHWISESDSFGKCEQWHLAGVYGSDWFCADAEKKGERK